MHNDSLKARAEELARVLYPLAVREGCFLVCAPDVRVGVGGLRAGWAQIAGKWVTLEALVAHRFPHGPQQFIDDFRAGLEPVEPGVGDGYEVPEPHTQEPESVPERQLVPAQARSGHHPPERHAPLPQSADAEKAVLSSFIIAPKAVAAECERRGLCARHFHLPHHQTIFEALTFLEGERMLNNDGYDLIPLTQQLAEAKTLDHCGGQNYLTELATFMPIPANVEQFISTVLERHARRQMIVLAERLEAGARDELTDVGNVIEEGRSGMEKLANEADAARDEDRSTTTRSFKQLMEYDTEHDPNAIIGRRWACRSGSCLWIGQSGIGKSSLAMQTAVYFAVGLPIFGITPKGPLKSVFIQAENDDGDLAEMAQGVMKHIVETLDVTEDMEAMWQKNLLFVRDTVHTGVQFVTAARRIVRQHKPDLIWIDPLLSYVGDDISKQAVASEFLRNWINPIAAETGVCFMFLHHTGKPSTDPKSKAHWKDADMAYASFGSSELVNWARAVNVLRPIGDGVFELHLTKRGKRAGALDLNGEFTDKIYLAYAEVGIAWRQVEKPTEDEADASKAKSKSSGQFKAKYANAHDKLLGVIKEREGDWPKVELVAAGCARLRCADKTMYRYIKEMKAHGLIVETLDGRISPP